jgi:hypothetical protein
MNNPTGIATANKIEIPIATKLKAGTVFVMFDLRFYLNLKASTN